MCIFSQLIEYFHLVPDDLWPNTGSFYREIETASKRKNMKKIVNATMSLRSQPSMANQVL
jgi:hypothetical protein